MERTKPRYRHLKVENPEENTPLHQAMDTVREIALFMLTAVFVFTFLFRVITVSGTSMLPNFSGGDRLIISMLSRNFKMGDVVVAVNVLDDPIIKRVIATEGQEVRIDYVEGVVYVDDEPVDETAFGLPNGNTHTLYSSLEATKLPAVVPENCVFVLGDNRSVSEDSRYADVGMIDTRNLLGKAVLFVYPLSKFGWIGG